LQVGTPSNKNLPRVIEACDWLPVTLVIIGKLRPEQSEALAKFNVQYENRFDLDRAALVDEYRRADAVILASTYEGFGLPITEAQAVGRPVITSNVCSMPEAAGGAAILVDPLKVSEIRAAIQKLIDDPAYCNELVERGYANVTRYAPERIAADFANVYRLVDQGQR
jgi:glycosyltransferase involved in cell wall biosynthesis